MRIRVLIISLFFILLFGCEAKNLSESKNNENSAIVNQLKIELRAQASFESESIKILKKDNKVTVLAISLQRQQLGDLTAHWFKVKKGRHEGWIFGSYIDLHFDESILEIVNISPDGNEDDIVENLNPAFYGVYVNSDFEHLSIFFRDDNVFISDGRYEWSIKKNIDNVENYKFNERNNIWIYDDEVKYFTTDRRFNNKRYNLIFQSENTEEIINYFEDQNKFSDQLKWKWKWGIYYNQAENIAYHIKPEFSKILVYIYTLDDSDFSISDIFTTEMNQKTKSFIYNNFNYSLLDINTSSNWVIKGNFKKYWEGQNLFDDIYDFAEIIIEQDLGFDKNMINIFTNSKYALFNDYSNVIIFSLDMKSIILEGIPFFRGAIFETIAIIDETRLDDNLIGFRFIKTDGVINDYENGDIKMISDFDVTIYYRFDSYSKYGH